VFLPVFDCIILIPVIAAGPSSSKLYCTPARVGSRASSSGAVSSSKPGCTRPALSPDAVKRRAVHRRQHRRLVPRRDSQALGDRVECRVSYATEGRTGMTRLRSWMFSFCRSTVANVRLRSGEGHCLPGVASKVLFSRGAGRARVVPWAPTSLLRWVRSCVDAERSACGSDVDHGRSVKPPCLPVRSEAIEGHARRRRGEADIGQSANLVIHAENFAAKNVASDWARSFSRHSSTLCAERTSL
jgi:hypothetical protein